MKLNSSPGAKLIPISTAIQAPLHPPPVHPHDKALLKPLASLGKPKFNDSGVSFLRRTEYISSHTSKSRFESTTSRSLISNTGSRTKRPISNIDKESPEYIKSEVERSFQIAAQNLKNSNIMRHPSKRNLKLIDASPLLPDHNAFTDAGGYVTIKFLTNPVPPSSTYDKRVAAGFLQPMEPLASEEAAREEARQLHAQDPERYPAVVNEMEYEFFMTENMKDTINYKRKYDMFDPERDSDELYTRKNPAGEGVIRFARTRGYESASLWTSVTDQYDEEVCLAASDGTDGIHQKAVYYYPILQRIIIRPQRRRNIANKKYSQDPATQQEELERQTDCIDLKIEEANEELRTQRAAFVTKPYGIDPADQAEDGETLPVEDDGEPEAGLPTPDSDAEGEDE